MGLRAPGRGTHTISDELFILPAEIASSSRIFRYRKEILFLIYDRAGSRRVVVGRRRKLFCNFRSSRRLKLNYRCRCDPEKSSGETTAPSMTGRETISSFPVWTGVERASCRRRPPDPGLPAAGVGRRVRKRSVFCPTYTANSLPSPA